MNQQTQLKLQAYLDNELSGREAREMAALLESDVEAQALATELKDVVTAVRQNQPEFTCPESREFYWSKIERSLRQTTELERAPVPASRRSLGWMRLLAPAAGLAILLMMSLSVVKLATRSGTTSYLHEIETPLKETSAISFHSQSAGVTVVWVQSRPFYEE
jgi:anti-sigma factor RsiW